MKLGLVLMAAGAGTRFGGGKLTAEFRGAPLYRRALSAVPAGVFEAVAVVSAIAQLLEEAKAQGFLPVVNDRPEDGVSRTIAAAVEQHYDEKGLIWPKAMAPYHASLVIVNVKDEAQVAAAEDMYQRLQDAGFDILLDDRKERAGVKFNDADLIGLPVRITVGKKIGDGIVEYKLRTSDDVEECTIEEAIEKLTAFYNE